MNFIKLGLDAVIAKLSSFSSEEYWTLKTEKKNQEVAKKLQSLKVATYHNSGFAAKRAQRIAEGHKKYAQQDNSPKVTSGVAGSYSSDYIVGYASGYTSGSSNNP